MSKRTITVYTTNNCAYCVQVKKFLTIKGFDYQEVNVEQDPERRQEAIDLSGGAMTVPITVVQTEDGSYKHATGYNPGQLASILA